MEKVRSNNQVFEILKNVKIDYFLFENQGQILYNANLCNYIATPTCILFPVAVKLPKMQSRNPLGLLKNCQISSVVKRVDKRDETCCKTFFGFQR
jgi:hypothetical protein